MSSPFRWLDEAGMSYDLPEVEAWKALLRIGGVPERIVRWALGWVDLAQTSMTEEQWLVLRKEIGALGSIIVVSPDYFDTIVHRKISSADSEEIQVKFRLPTREAAQRFSSLMTACIEDLVRGLSATVGPLLVTVSVGRRMAGRITAQRAISYQVHSIADEALYKVLGALQACGGLVGRCPECSRLFLGDRINQVYCSSACQSRVTSRAFRKEHPRPTPKRRHK